MSHIQRITWDSTHSFQNAFRNKKKGFWNYTYCGFSSLCLCFSSCYSFHFQLLYLLFFSLMQARPRTLKGKWHREMNHFLYYLPSLVCLCRFLPMCSSAFVWIWCKKRISLPKTTQTFQSRKCTVTCTDQITAETRGYLPGEALSCLRLTRGLWCSFFFFFLAKVHQSAWPFLSLSEEAGEQWNRKTCGYSYCQAAPPVNLPSPVVSAAVTANNTEARPQRELVL